MRTAYFDCSSGVSGNMIIGAMIAAGMPVEDLKKEIDKVLPGGSYGLVVENLGTSEDPFTYFNTTIMDPREQGKGMGEMEAAAVASLVRQSGLDEVLRAEVLRIFWALVSAKAEAHGSLRESVTFRHEGLTDTLIDILGAVLSLRYFGIDRVISTPLNVGSGSMLIGTRELTIPAPMTRILLREAPYYSDGRKGELVTPTGAAILSSLATEYTQALPYGLVPMGAGAPVPGSGPDDVLRVYGHPEEVTR